MDNQQSQKRRKSSSKSGEKRKSSQSQTGKGSSSLSSSSTKKKRSSSSKKSSSNPSDRNSDSKPSMLSGISNGKPSRDNDDVVPEKKDDSSRQRLTAEDLSSSIENSSPLPKSSSVDGVDISAGRSVQEGVAHTSKKKSKKKKKKKIRSSQESAADLVIDGSSLDASVNSSSASRQSRLFPAEQGLLVPELLPGYAGGRDMRFEEDQIDNDDLVQAPEDGFVGRKSLSLQLIETTQGGRDQPSTVKQNFFIEDRSGFRVISKERADELESKALEAYAHKNEKSLMRKRNFSEHFKILDIYIEITVVAFLAGVSFLQLYVTSSASRNMSWYKPVAAGIHSTYWVMLLFACMYSWKGYREGVKQSHLDQAGKLPIRFWPGFAFCFYLIATVINLYLAKSEYQIEMGQSNHLPEAENVARAICSMLGYVFMAVHYYKYWDIDNLLDDVVHSSELLRNNESANDEFESAA